MSDVNDGDHAFPVSLEQSTTRRHISSNARCVPETTQILSVLPVISFLTVSTCNSSAHRVQWFSSPVL